MRETFLPFAQPDIDTSELNEIKEALDAGWITTGPKTHQFEAEFAATVGAKHAVAVNSCTAAMHLALEAIGLQPGDLVLTTPYTFAATAEVIRYFDAVPVFVDVEPDTLNISPAGIREKVDKGIREQGDKGIRKQGNKGIRGEVDKGTREQREQENKEIRGQGGQVKAIIPVHVGGHPCDMEAILEIAHQYELAVIEDAAHALPASYRGHTIGSSLPFSLSPYSRIPFFTCFSFYATKTLTTGEGGMITTDDEELAERCRIMSLHGISKDAWKRYTAEGSWFYEIIAPGYKYNMTDVAAAMGLAQLRKVEKMWKRRKEIAACYTEAFSQFEELQVPTERSEIEHAWHLYVLRLNLEHFPAIRNPKSEIRNWFIEELKARNIGTSVHFIPLHLHPYYRETYGYQPEDFPVAYREYQRAISLPIYSKMTDQDVQDVIDAVLDVVETWKRE